MLIFVSVMFITLSQDLLLCDHAKKIIISACALLKNQYHTLQYVCFPTQSVRKLDWK